MVLMLIVNLNVPVHIKYQYNTNQFFKFSYATHTATNLWTIVCILLSNQP